MNIKQGIITLNYSGPIIERRVSLLSNTIANLEETLKEERVKGVLVSLKQATAEGDCNGLEPLVSQMDQLSRKWQVSIGFVDYSMPMYKVLKPISRGTRIKLFKNANAARLFLDPKAFKRGMEVLVYDEDEANTKQLSRELARFGYTVVHAKDREEFHTLIQERDYNVFVTQSALNASCEKEQSTKSLLKLSKKLIANLPVFMDTAVETLVAFTGLEAQKSSHSIKCFDTGMSDEMVCAVMRFKGDLEGAFVLLFPIEVAVIAMESLLGERVDENDMESIRDGVGEFCNTITGSTKTTLSNNGIKILFELPRTYTSIQSTMNDIGDENGVWIDMQLAGKPFYMFISK